MSKAHPRVAAAALMHESNSFNSKLTAYTDFRVLPSSIAAWSDGNSELAGFVSAAPSHGMEVVPVFAAAATPSGPVAEAAYEELLRILLQNLQEAGPLDAVYLALHGAMVADHIPGADEETVRRVRACIGPDVPFIVTHDFHANIAPSVATVCDALITYQQNPHTDTKQRGELAASIAARTVRGEVRPVQAIVRPDVFWNIVFQNTSEEPLASIVKDSRAVEAQPGILAASVACGYQWADVPWMGPAVVVVSDGLPEVAKAEAESLAQSVRTASEQLVLQLPDVSQAVSEAMASHDYPVALFDTGDNIGGGSAGDGTFLLQELLRRNACGWFVALWDPEAVREAVRLGPDGAFDFNVGGKSDDLHGPPVRVRGRVRSLHAGRYIEPEVRHGGARHHDLGATAVIEVEGPTPEEENLLQLTTLRSCPFSIHQLVSCGIYPDRQRVLVVKGTVAPRAAYEHVAKRVVLVDSPGSTAVNPSRFRYRRAPPYMLGTSEHT